MPTPEAPPPREPDEPPAPRKRDFDPNPPEVEFAPLQAWSPFFAAPISVRGANMAAVIHRDHVAFAYPSLTSDDQTVLVIAGDGERITVNRPFAEIEKILLGDDEADGEPAEGSEGDASTTEE